MIVAHIQRNQGKYGALTGALVTAAVLFIAPWEGYSAKPYRDSVGVETICYGQTAADGADFSKVYTKTECMKMLGADLSKYDAPLQRCLDPEVYAALPQSRHIALISLSYNIGGGTVCKSRIVAYLNAGDVEDACDTFLAYDHAGGKRLAGLTRRREAERELCRKDN